MADEQEKTDEFKVNLTSLVPKSIHDSLRESFPRETHESKKLDENFTVTGVKPAYIIERLNTVLGVEGWEAEELETKVDEPHYATKVKLTVYLIMRTPDGLAHKVPVAVRTQWGGAKRHKNSELGDVLKSAFTNGLCKAASMLDIAHEAYKGLLEEVIVESKDLQIDEAEAVAHDANKKKTTARSTPKVAEPLPSDTRALRKEILNKFTQKGLTRNDLEKLMQDNFGKTESRQLSDTELQKLSTLIDKIPDEPLTESVESLN
jgi:hypothetical protein